MKYSNSFVGQYCGIHRKPIKKIEDEDILIGQVIPESRLIMLRIKYGL